MSRSMIAFALLALPLPVVAQTAPQPAQTVSSAEPRAMSADERAMRSHVMFLADDTMLGRDAGSDTYNIAASYVASQFHANNLVPMGDNGSYLQRVPLMNYKLADQGEFLLRRPGGGDASQLEFGVDFVPVANPASEVTRVSGDLVFVGQGIRAPEAGIDDYAGVDVRGKIVVFLSGSPEGLHSEIRATMRDGAKAEVAASLGAVGAIAIGNPGNRRAPFAALASRWGRQQVGWYDPERTTGDDAVIAAAPLLATLSDAGAEKIFAGAPVSWAEIRQQASDPNARYRAMPLPTRLDASFRTEFEPFVSYNVAGMIPGSDPALAGELVVLTAHLDHVGVGQPNAAGDTIYNGAMDNAVGVASLIEEARRFRESGEPPRRSILFLAVTAEEKGLVGSDYFATTFDANATMAGKTMVANVNLDMPIITYAFEDVIAFGADRSSLGPIVRKAAADAGVAFSPDPMPEQSFFVRSDHYRFVQQGVPSVFLWPGAGGPGREAMASFLATHYHKPSDDVGQAPGIDWASGVRFINVNYQIARGIADADQKPMWNAGDYFGMLYNGPMAQ